MKTVHWLGIIGLIASSQIFADTVIVDEYCGEQNLKAEKTISVGKQFKVSTYSQRRNYVVESRASEPNQRVIAAVNERIEVAEPCSSYMRTRLNHEPRARVTFDFNQSNVTSEGQYVLNAVAKQTARGLVVAGNADAVGEDEYNLTLGGQRANSVADYLATKGVAKLAIDQVSFGEDAPIASNISDSGRALNRRVDITFK